MNWREEGRKGGEEEEKNPMGAGVGSQADSTRKMGS